MEIGGETTKEGKHVGGVQQVCQICGDGVGTTIDGDLFVACDVCRFPVCRPCYEYERKDGNQSCPQCKTKYKRIQGSPPIRGEEGGDVDVDDVSDFDYSAGGQDQKQKIAERMLSWHMNCGRGDNVGPPKYDSGEIPRTHVHRFTHSQVLSGELSGASPDMSPGAGGGKRVLPIPYLSHSPNPSREFSGVFGNVAWKERVDGWKMKQEKSGSLMTNGTSHAPSEGKGINDIDVSTEYIMDDDFCSASDNIKFHEARNFVLQAVLQGKCQGDWLRQVASHLDDGLEVGFLNLDKLKKKSK